MIRGNYQSWSYSPLDQITRQNVSGLQLAWVWAMSEGGWNEPSPVVHDGILYLTNTGSLVQALDARTGELIWEHGLSTAARGYNTTRSRAMYQDKLFIANTDATLIALDARDGHIAWRTTIADYRKGFMNTSGPIVVNGKVVQGLNGCDRFTGDRCFISAYDSATGTRLWTLNTIPRTDEPGGET